MSRKRKSAFFENAGFYHNIKEAVNAVEENKDDLFEGIFLYAIVLEFDEGLYNTPNKEIWFKWSKNQNKYVTCKKPVEKYNFLEYEVFSI